MGEVTVDAIKDEVAQRVAAGEFIGVDRAGPVRRAARSPRAR